MEFITSNQKIFMVLVLFTISVNFSNADDSTPKPVHFNSLYDDIENITVDSTNDSIIRDKRFFDAYSNLNWCYDKTRYDSGASLGLYSNTDQCCKNHVLCRRNKFQTLVERFDLSCLDAEIKPCTCEEEFRTCLKNVWIYTISEQVGRDYFTLGRKCITQANIERSCIRYGFNTRRKYKCMECNFNQLNYYKQAVAPYS